MNKYLSKLIMVALMLNFVFTPAGLLAAPRFDYSNFTVATGWSYGSDEYWHLKPTGTKTQFEVGEKVQFFAQVGRVNYSHQWRLVLYRNNVQYRIETNPRFNTDAYNGWNYSNFVPSMTNLPVGEYRADYQLSTSQGFEKLASVNFRVVSKKSQYNVARVVVASGWKNGTKDYWNIQPVGQKTAFAEGDTVYLVSQLTNIKVDHRYRVELYRVNGQMSKIWESITPWNYVGNGWTYSNYQPSYSNAPAGNYEFRLFIDTGNGWQSLATKSFKVGSVPDQPRRPYYYDRTTVARDWKNGVGSEYWNIMPVDPRNTFNPGDDVTAVSIARNIIDNYQWKAELYRNGSLVWQDTTPWRDVGLGQAYGSYYPEYANAQAGNYEWRIYLNTGSGFKLLDTKTFTVANQPSPICNNSNNYCNYDCRYYNNCQTRINWTYNGATIAESWTYYGSDQRNIQAVNPKTTFNRGATVYIIAQARNVKVNHRWSIEAYRNSTLLWTYKSPWNNLNGVTWPYSSVVTSNFNSEYGSYEYRIFFDDGTGFRQVDSKYFYVNY